MDASFLVLALLLVPVVIGVGLWMSAQRVKAVKAWAAQVGWAYLGSDASLIGRWQGRPFRIGHSKRVSELVAGPFQGRQAASFAYRYTTGSGKNQSTVTFHILVLQLPAYLPTLELTPDGLGAKLAKTLGGQDIPR